MKLETQIKTTAKRNERLAIKSGVRAGKFEWNGGVGDPLTVANGG